MIGPGIVLGPSFSGKRCLMADPETIYNWRRLDDRITTSGQRTEKQLADIHALGVRHIVSLGLHTHEKALQKPRGRYHTHQEDQAVRLARRPHHSDNCGHVHIPEHAERAMVLAVSMWCGLSI